MDLSIIILNYKTRGLLKQCLRGIELYDMGLSHEIIVVDNASCDGTREMMKSEFNRCVFIETKKNIGFGAGMNHGIKTAKGTYVLLLNTDVAILNNALRTMYDYMEKNQKVGLGGPRLINPDGSVQLSCYRFPSFLVALWRRSPIGKLPLIKNKLRKYLMIDFNHSNSQPVDWVLGACMIVRKEAIKSVGLFDERFFLYVEDTDWCRRFWDNQWEVHYISEAELVHYHERKSAENPGLVGVFSYATRVHISSWIKYFLKYKGSSLPKTTSK
ncbi:glycosyltransferase family 2 protein [Patescibacteria group bacterium]